MDLLVKSKKTEKNARILVTVFKDSFNLKKGEKGKNHCFNFPTFKSWIYNNMAKKQLLSGWFTTQNLAKESKGRIMSANNSFQAIKNNLSFQKLPNTLNIKRTKNYIKIYGVKDTSLVTII